jgi:hypothetical protein
MTIHELLRFLSERLETLQVTHLITGSMASVAFGEPRFTNDIDVVVDLPTDKIDSLCAAFPEPEFYLSAQAVQAAVQRRSQFNILHPESGLKIDVMIASDSAFDRSRLLRGRPVAVFADRTVSFASPEDVILMKMVYFREGGSDKHLRDCAGILRVQADKVDHTYIADWATRLGVLDIWQALLVRLQT